VDSFVSKSLTKNPGGGETIMAFEPNVAPFITGNMATPHVHDPGLNPVSIIRTSDAWQVHVTWDTSGLFVPLVNPAASWNISAYLESIGPGPEAVIATGTEPFGPPANAHNYSKVLNIAAGAVPAGPYKLVVVITLTSAGVPMPIAAFSEGPLLTFFTAS
jgi:hypothetical protein